MKNLFKKHDLFKILFIIVLAVAILTWIIPSGAFSSSTYVSSGLVRAGIVDFFLTLFYSAYYMLLDVTFLVALGGFYGVLSNTNAYSYLVYKIAKKVRINKKAFIVITSLLLALFSASATSLLIPLLFVPFIISILRKLHFSKIQSFCATFGAIFIGYIAPLFSNGTTSPFGFVNASLELTSNSGLAWKFAFFIISFALLMFFTFMKRSKNQKEEVVVDRFQPVEIEKKQSFSLLVIILSLVAIIGVIGYLPWVDSFNILFFDELHANIISFKLGDVPIFSYLLNSTDPLGFWDLDIISMVLVGASFIIALSSKKGADGFIKSFVDGVKSIVNPVFIFILVNCVFVLAYWSPMSATIVNKLIPAGSSFNLFKLILVGIITTFLNVDYGFVGYSYITYIHSVYATKSISTMLVLNSIYGVCQFILPTGILLFFALSYLNISYKEYLSKMWKYILGLFSIIVVLQIAAIYF